MTAPCLLPDSFTPIFPSEYSLPEYSGAPKAWLQAHSLRDALLQEIHARPFPVARAPLRVAQLAVLCGEGGAAAEHSHLEELCRIFDAALPDAQSSFYSADFGAFELRYERHTEFFTYTILQPGEFAEPFEFSPIELLPEAWLETLTGQVVSALNIALETAEKPERTRDELHRWFDDYRLIASEVVDGSATVWTSLRADRDGFVRIYVRDRSLTDCRAGRLVQRLAELETYRLLALLALPLAREIGPQITQLDETLGGAIADIAGAQTIDDERRLLKELSQLAARVEKLRARSSYRFSAARAYHAIAERRLEELRETQITGLLTLGEFLGRRMPPAMRTCTSVGERAEDLSRRIDRASDLLRTRIDLTLEAQNQELLASMNNRAHLQLRLQQTVEGFSVAAISYYVLNLLEHGLGALRAMGLPLSHTATTALALPLAVLLAWWSTHRVKRGLEKH